jgi:hypothetical protein
MTIRKQNCFTSGVMPQTAVIAFILFTMALTGCTNRRFADRVVTPEWTDFSQNVQNYTSLVDKLEKGLPPLPDKAEAQQITAHKKALADAIREARKGAKPGDILTPSIQERMIAITRTEVRGAAGEAAKKTIAEDNPNKPGQPAQATLAVNAVYPDGAPLSTVPPTLLLRLPKLPETVEYRFVGKALMLRDVRANIIVDYIPNALS